VVVVLDKLAAQADQAAVVLVVQVTEAPEL
jgi:hypothetical protein